MIGQKQICLALVTAINLSTSFYMILMHSLSKFLHISANRCSPVLEIENAKADGVLALPGNIMTYTCDQGFMFSDKTLQKSIQCIKGEWNDTQESCTGS